MNNLIYGIDFGTTNSAISVYNNGKVEVIPINNSTTQLQSILYFPEVFVTDIDNFFVGNDAISNYISSNMKGRLLQSIKSFLPDSSFTSTNIYGNSYELDDLIALILSKLKRIADEHIGKDIKSVILGRPAMFSENRQEEDIALQRLKSAAKKAGFNEIYLQLEPISAALEYEATIKKEELTLVADFGGGTSDFTIMKLSPASIKKSDRSSDILGVKGVYIGGDKLNSRIMLHKLTKYFGASSEYETYPGRWLAFPQFYIHEICKWHKISFLKKLTHRESLRKIYHGSNDKDAIKRLMVLIDEDLGFSLFQNIEKAKCNLSKWKFHDIIFNESIINIKEPITRDEFDCFIKRDIDKINNCIDTLLKEVNLSPSNIDTVFMTGGSSYVPIIRTLIENKFGFEKVKSDDIFLSVVAGLALSAKYDLMRVD